MAEKLWEYAITSRLTTSRPQDPKTNGLNEKLEDADVDLNGAGEGEKPLEEHPLLLSETAWNSAKNREKAIEVAMESWGAPAFWLARNSVLAAFGAGKATALVIDIGASTTSVVAVHDGLILKKSVQKSNLAGNWISGQVRQMLQSQDPKVELTPHFMIQSKTPVDAGQPAQATYRKYENKIHDSFRVLEEERVLHEFKESVVSTWTAPGRLHSQNQSGMTNFDFAKQQPGHVFEMPDGSNQMWGAERFTVVEGLFDERVALPVAGEQVLKSQTIPELVRLCLNGVDLDLRPALLANVVVTGGTTLVRGLTTRLENELMSMYPGGRVRIQAAGLTYERRFGSWIGGSILGSLGTFHQMWISKKEYEEFGAGIVEKRCK